jgi:hypothetical protein
MQLTNCVQLQACLAYHSALQAAVGWMYELSSSQLMQQEAAKQLQLKPYAIQ